MTKYQIRRIKSHEADLYREVRLKALADSPHAFGSTFAEASTRSEESWLEQARTTASGKERATFLAFDHDKPVGLAAIYRDESSSKTGDLIQMWTSPNLRGSGIGRSLIEALLNWATENDFKTIQTEVTRANETILPFYEKLGFEKQPENSDNHILNIEL